MPCDTIEPFPVRVPVLEPLAPLGDLLVGDAGGALAQAQWRHLLPLVRAALQFINGCSNRVHYRPRKSDRSRLTMLPRSTTLDNISI
jgi:hypothetical protein